MLLGPLDVWRLGAGAEPELAALACELDESGSARAERLFDEAADLHAGHLLHWELRCRWGAAEAALRRGDTAGAKARLLVLEERLEDGAMRPLLGRVRGSLRRVGVVREPRRQAQGGPGRLSAREREVMTLVAAGQSSAKIALRLGVSPATVESQVRSAMAKLGAKTRLQAALLAAEE